MINKCHFYYTLPGDASMATRPTWGCDKRPRPGAPAFRTRRGSGGSSRTGRLYAMEGERERLREAIGQAVTDAAKAEGQIGEHKCQTQQLREKFQEEVASSVVDARQKISDLRQKLTTA